MVKYAVFHYRTCLFKPIFHNVHYPYYLEDDRPPFSFEVQTNTQMVLEVNGNKVLLWSAVPKDEALHSLSSPVTEQKGLISPARNMLFCTKDNRLYNATVGSHLSSHLFSTANDLETVLTCLNTPFPFSFDVKFEA